MARLDADEREAERPQPRAQLTPAEVRGYLESLADWWHDVDESDRRALAEALFARVRVRGGTRWWIDPTPEAIAAGLPAAFGSDDVEMVGARGLAATISMSSSPLFRAVRKAG